MKKNKKIVRGFFFGPFRSGKERLKIAESFDVVRVLFRLNEISDLDDRSGKKKGG